MKRGGVQFLTGAEVLPGGVMPGEPHTPTPPHWGPAGPPVDSAAFKDSLWGQVQKWKALDHQARLPCSDDGGGKGCPRSRGQSVPQPGLKPGLTLTPQPSFPSFLFFLFSFFSNFTFCFLKASKGNAYLL